VAHARQRAPEQREDPAAAVAVLDRGGADHHDQQQPDGVDHDQRLAASFVETVVMTDSGLGVLSRLPRALIDIAV
jgi:hypothetical protein